VTQDLSTWQEVVLVAGPAIAAIAAIASWASVWQARRLARDAGMPHLMVQKIKDANDGTVGSIITNAGGGPARGAGVWISHPPFCVKHSLGHGFLYPGEVRRVWTNIPMQDSVETDVMAMCRDRDSFAHYWTAAEKHRVIKTRFRRRPKHGTDPAKLFAEFHPGVDLNALTDAQIAVTDDSK
jgi:hypothetical protein